MVGQFRPRLVGLDLFEAHPRDDVAHRGETQNVADRRADRPLVVAPIHDDEQPAWAQEPHDLGQRPWLVVQVMKYVDHEDAVGHGVGRRDRVGVRLHQFQPLSQLRRDLVAQQLREPGQRLDGEHAALRHSFGDRHGVYAGPCAVVDHGLGAVKAQERHDRRLRKGFEARRVLQPAGVLWVEGVGHQPATVVTSNSGG